MKKTIGLLLFFALVSFSSVQALSWAYPFVVWKGNVYEVKQTEIIEKSQIGPIIGEVKTKPDEMTGSYYGNASNYYPIGTGYYEIKGTPVSAAIAVKENDQWMRAIYVHDAPFHIMNVVASFYFILAAVILALIIVTIFWRRMFKNRSKNT